MKSKTVQIYVLGYRETTEPYPDNEIYTPLEVGSWKRKKPLFEMRDTQGDNIGEWNPIYCEMTGIYEIYQNTDIPDIIGCCQYRRRLLFKDAAEVENIFKSSDAIAAEPLMLPVAPYEQYARCHNRGDMELAEQVVKDCFPEYAKAWDAYMKKGNTLFYSNGFVMRRQDFLDYCDFYFGFAEEFRKRKGWDTVEKARSDIEGEMIRGERKKTRGLDYQSFVLGFLSERMLTLFLLTRFGMQGIKTVKYQKLEGI